MHARSKREVYELLKMKGGYNLSPIEQTNREYIYDIMTRSKKVWFLCYYILGNPHEISVHYSRSSYQRTNCSRDDQRSKETYWI